MRVEQIELADGLGERGEEEEKNQGRFFFAGSLLGNANQKHIEILLMARIKKSNDAKFWRRFGAINTNSLL